mgnify:CR=1 FL=1
MFLDVRDLTITLKTGEEIAKDISFSIDGGEMLSIVGSSGAGKTTVCKAVMGLLSSNYSISGEVLYRGENLLHCSKKRLQAIYGKEICYIMQNPMTAFNPSLRIGRQLEKTCYLHNPQISRQELQLLVSNTLQQLGLDDLKRILKSYPDALSGGMLQRIMIAAALINQPTILVADEATTAIDACNRIELMQLLRQLCSGGMAILFVTHDLRAASMADRILIMNDGQLVEAGTTEQICNTCLSLKFVVVPVRPDLKGRQIFLPSPCRCLLKYVGDQVGQRIGNLADGAHRGIDLAAHFAGIVCRAHHAGSHANGCHVDDAGNHGTGFHGNALLVFLVF